MKVLEARQYADILLKEVRLLTEGSETYSPGVSFLYRELGRKVYTRYQIERKKRNGTLDKMSEIYAAYCDTLSDGHDHEKFGDNSRQAWQRLTYHNMDGPSLDALEKPWPIAIQNGIGRFLYNIMMHDLKIDTNVLRPNGKTTTLMPAFYSLFRNHGKNIKQEVKPHPTLIKLYRGSQQENLIFDSNLIPMLCPPRPWIDENNGGYLLHRSDLIRLPHQAMQQLNRIENMPDENLYPSLDALNQLSRVAWTVNGDMLDVALEVFNSGGSDKLDVPRPPNALEVPPELQKQKADIAAEDKAKVFKMKMAFKRKQSEMYSLWCDALYRLSLASHVSNLFLFL